MAHPPTKSAVDLKKQSLGSRSRGSTITNGDTRERDGVRIDAEPQPYEEEEEVEKPPPQVMLLNLHPGKSEDSLVGKLAPRRRISDDGVDPPVYEDYEALSYFWGEPSENPPCIRILKKKGFVKLVNITPNLESSLRHLRLENSTRRLWIDALCINQEDEIEKSEQIPIMGRIFSQASNVCVWLGNKTDSSPKALELIRRILDLRAFDRLVDERFTAEWAALSELMRRDWFSRRWVVQEIAFARRASVHCGPDTISWIDLADAVALFGSRAPEIARLFRSDKNYNHRVDFLGDVDALGANRLVQTISKLFRKSDDGAKLEPLLSLESLISNLSAFKASRPHDIIYAVLSLANDTITSAKSTKSNAKRRQSIVGAQSKSDLDISHTLAAKFIGLLQKRVENKTFHVDYKKKTFYEVCKDFISFTIKSSQSLDMLCRPWAPDKEDLPDNDKSDLPSWICRLQYSPFRPRPDGNYSRVNADLLVGVPDSGRRSYNASANTRPEFVHFGADNTGNQSLFVHGFILDTIKETRIPAIEGNVPHEWLEFGGWANTASDPPESFWRTLVADRDDKGHNPPSYYRRACQYAFSQRVSGGALNTERLITNENSKIMADYLKRVQAVVWMKGLVKTARDNRLGLVPNRAREGDLLCILRGCSVPVVLRRLEQPNLSTMNSFESSLASFNVVPDPVDVPLPVSPVQERNHVANGLNGVVNGKPKSLAKGSAFDNAVKERASENPVLVFHDLIPCQLIGECYLHGTMDGEAFKIKDEQNILEVEFELQ